MKYLILILIVNAFFLQVLAQKNNTLGSEIANQLSFFKENSKNLEIVFKEKLFYNSKEEKRINPVELTKDSLRHFLVDHGFYDYNFEYFQFTLKNLKELNDVYINKLHPELNKLLSDSLYNKVTFYYKEENGNLVVDAIISKNFIEVDKVHGKVAIGTGYTKNELTYEGISTMKSIFYSQTDRYSKVFNLACATKQILDLDEDNRFSITADISSYESIYATITNASGDILSIIKVF